MNEAMLTAEAITVLGQWTGGWQVERLLKYRENAVFAVSDATGQRAVLRLHRPGYHNAAALHSELSWMSALVAQGFPAPSPIRAANGAMIVPYGTGANGFADMMSWVPGRPVVEIDDLPTLTRIYATLGDMLGRMHRDAAHWTPPADFFRPAWDHDALLGETPLWGNFRAFPGLHGAGREIVLHAAERASEALRALSTGPAHYGLIHADALADNVIFDEHAGVTLIDFDDCGPGWFLFDIVTCLYFHTPEDRLPVLERAFLSAYRHHFHFDTTDRDHLPLFMFLRALTYVGWVQSRPETETARELGDAFARRAEELARAYLAHRTV